MNKFQRFAIYMTVFASMSFDALSDEGALANGEYKLKWTSPADGSDVVNIKTRLSVETGTIVAPGADIAWHAHRNEFFGWQDSDGGCFYKGTLVASGGGAIGHVFCGLKHFPTEKVASFDFALTR